MTLLNQQKKRQAQILQQVKELARAGQWQEAKELIDTLPNTPDVVRIRERIEKQLFIATGEVPAVMEGSMAIAEMDEDVNARDPIQKSKESAGGIPSYLPIRVVAYLLYGGGVLAAAGGALSFILSFGSSSIYADAARATAFTIFVSGLFTVASGALMLMFVDIARNTFVTNRLLKRLIEENQQQ